MPTVAEFVETAAKAQDGCQEFRDSGGLLRCVDSDDLDIEICEDCLRLLSAAPTLRKLVEAATSWSKRNDDACLDCLCFHGLDDAMQSVLDAEER